jgi:phage terminase large subunit-like protein
MHFRTRTKKGGRGFSGDFLALDEAMIIAEFMLGALLPTLRARPNPQVWYTGSAVDQTVHEYGVAFARVRERALAGKDEDLAYFEWSVDEENPSAVTREMAENEDLWKQSNPALDIRISREHMRKELNALDLRTFSVELLGIGDWPSTGGTTLSPILPSDWDALEDENSALQDPVVLAYDVSPERRTSIAAAGMNQYGQWHVEIIATWPGTKWLAERLAQLVDEQQPTEVLCDGYGPAASMVGACAEAGVFVRTINSSEHSQACGKLADAVVQGTLRHLGSTELQNAVRGAAIRPLGDAWAWSRKTSAVDISPLVAATLALSSAIEHPDDGEPPEIW